MSGTAAGPSTGGPFETYADADVRDLLAEYPLAWLVAPGESAASLLPLLGEYDDGGRLVSLLGHMGRRNRLHALLAAAPTATVLVNGPQAYVSPAHAGRQNWGPTWNYAQLVLTVEVTFLPAEIDHALTALVHAMEGDRWQSQHLGERYAGMTAAIIAFRAQVTGITGRFKLGQDEDDAVFAAILRNHPDAALRRWMERFNRHRG